MFGTIFWQNSNGKSNSMVYDNNEYINNIGCEYQSSYINSINTTASQSNNSEYQLNNSSVHFLNNSLLPTSVLFEKTYDSYQIAQKNILLDFHKSSIGTSDYVNKKKRLVTKKNSSDETYNNAKASFQNGTNTKFENFEINSSIPNSIKMFMKQRRFSMRQRQVANQRERDRTHSVNSAFLHLRSMIPTDPVDRKLSKIETLRLAGSYINHLNAILNSPPEYADKPCLNRLKFTQPEKNGIKDDRDVCTFCLGDKKLAFSTL